ncbi:MAG: hypothetical protein V4549_06715 [Bacteroidota bacterium]
MATKQEVQELKKIDLKAGSFKANKVEYFIETSISFSRFKMFQKLQIEAGYGIGFYELFESLKKIYDLCNDKKFADIAVLTHNTLRGIKDIDERPNAALQLCALFMNTKDEDRKIINDDIVNKKIADWEAEGLDIMPFFQVATSSMKNFWQAYGEISLSSLEAMTKNK